ncbi:MAG TPA: hypothetical protein VNV60_06595 [Holophagaceae bacterium]|jgi:hypothetical protein|nr:hypothetical protein [Holophagaceae bacterium]
MPLAFLSVDPLAMLKWFHFLVLAMAGGGGIVALLLSGFESERPDLQGLAATVWKRTATWGFRLAVLIGIAMLFLKMSQGDKPFATFNYLHIKLLLVFFLLACVEMAPKMLAKGKRGAAMLALLLFMATAFVVYNKDLFAPKTAAPQAAVLVK